MSIFVYIFVFILGSIVGSFLNVCIWRLPKEESVVTPRSHCVNCRKPIYWYDNVPFLSYVFLGGKCRFCKAKISFRYFLVELLTAGMFVWFFSVFGISVKFFVYTALCCGLIVATFVDFKYQIIPDEITLGGLIVGLLVSVVFPGLHGVSSHWNSLLISLGGMLAGGLSIYLIGLLGAAVFKKEAMGGGDVKLMAMIGSFIGWKLVLLVFFLAPFFGSAVGIILKLKYKVEHIPYGPYLSLATLICIFWGEDILRWLFF